MTVARSDLVGSGVYDLGRASHLLGIRQDTLARWAKPAKTRPKPVLSPTHGWAYSFHDLLSLAVIAVLWQRKISVRKIQAADAFLQDYFQTDRPFAHREIVNVLRTHANDVFLLDQSTHPPDLLDASRKGQGVLYPLLETYLLPVEYGPDHLATLWRPWSRIWVNPEVQAGIPCIDGTRVTSDVLFDRAVQGESHQLIAQDLGVTEEDVRHGIEFERRLNHGHGIALLDQAA